MIHSALVDVVLADSGESKKSGPIGLAVIIVLCVVCYFLFKSMSKHLKKVREESPDGKPSSPKAREVAEGDAGAASSNRASVISTGSVSTGSVSTDSVPTDPVPTDPGRIDSAVPAVEPPRSQL